MNTTYAVQHNVDAHDSVATTYESTHGEIFNPVEQARLRSSLAHAVTRISTDERSKRVLDYGCGSGNLTRHLLDLDCHVVSADVSEKFLRLVRERFGVTGRLKTMRPNGTDLSDVPDEYFDLVATYSVLHHVPDYLGLVRELARVTKRGGIVYLDHELSSSYWTPDPLYAEFQEKVQPKPQKHWSRFFVFSNYVTLLRRKFNPRYKPEGDIHVWPDDHIEWYDVSRVLESAGCTIVFEEDYLLFGRGYAPDVYEEFQGKCADTHLLVAQKR